MIDDPLLVEMIFCPILFYGGAQEHDIDFDQFSILFRSIFLEGLARPLAGIQRDPQDARPAASRSTAASCGCGRASRRIAVKDGAVEKVVLEDGTELEARNVLSSAGLAETMRLLRRRPPDDQPHAGRISLVESISDARHAMPRTLGYDQTIVFYNDSETVSLREAGRSGRPAERNGLLAQQFRLSRAAGRRDHAHHGAGQLRGLGGIGAGAPTGRRSWIGTTGWRRRRCGSCPTSAPQ